MIIWIEWTVEKLQEKTFVREKTIYGNEKINVFQKWGIILKTCAKCIDMNAYDEK